MAEIFAFDATFLVAPFWVVRLALIAPVRAEGVEGLVSSSWYPRETSVKILTIDVFSMV
jgi:hypothetical protein